MTSLPLLSPARAEPLAHAPSIHPGLRCPDHPAAPLRAIGSDLLECVHCGTLYGRTPGGAVDLVPRDAPAFFREEANQWDEQAERYEEKRARDLVYMAGINAAVRALGRVANQRVLDAGCGTGLTTRLLSQGLGEGEMVALDASGASLDYLRRRLPTRRLTTVRGDLMHLPFADASFDRVLCANAMQQIPGRENQAQVIAELARVVRPGGKVVVSVHAYSFRKRWLGWEKVGNAGGQSGAVKFVHRFDAPELKSLLGEQFTVNRLVGAAFPLPYRMKLSPLSKLAERLFNQLPQVNYFGDMLIAECVKK